MSLDETHNIIAALNAAFGDKPWLLGESLKKAPVKKAVAKAMRKPASQLKTADLKNLVNELWSAGHVEIIPPKDQERSFKYRMVAAASPSAETPTTPAPAKSNDSVPAADDDIVQAYSQLRMESQFRHVYLADIFDKTGIALEKLHAWASYKARNREFELGQADWSLATERQRSASIKINGVHYLTVGLLS